MTLLRDDADYPESRLCSLWLAVQARIRDIFNGTNERDQAQRTAFMAFAIRVVSAGIAYLTQVALARWMGSSEYGIFVFVWVWVLVLGGLSPLGFNVALLRFVPEYRERGMFAELRGILLSSRLIAVGVASTLAGLGLGGLALFGHLLDNNYVLPLYLALFCLPAFALTDVQDGIGRSQAWMRLALAPPYILRPMLILIGMVVTHEIGLPMVASTAAGCAIVATWVTAITQFLLTQRRLARTVPAGERAYKIGPWLATGLPILMINAFELLMQNTDVLVLSQYVPASEVGYYFAALKTISLVAFVHYAVGSAIAHRISTFNARGDRAGLQAFVRDATIWTFWPSLAGGLVLLAIGGPLLSLFGTDFVDAYHVMFILIGGLMLRAAVGPAEFVLNMMGAQNLCATVLAGSAVMNLALNFLLIPHYGIVGAATATSLSLALASVMFSIFARQKLGLVIAIWEFPLMKPAEKGDDAT